MIQFLWIEPPISSSDSSKWPTTLFAVCASSDLFFLGQVAAEAWNLRGGSRIDWKDELLRQLKIAEAARLGRHGKRGESPLKIIGTNKKLWHTMTMFVFVCHWCSFWCVSVGSPVVSGFGPGHLGIDGILSKVVPIVRVVPLQSKSGEVRWGHLFHSNWDSKCDPQFFDKQHQVTFQS